LSLAQKHTFFYGRPLCWRHLFLWFLVEKQTETGYQKLLSSNTEDKDFVRMMICPHWCGGHSSVEIIS